MDSDNFDTLLDALSSFQYPQPTASQNRDTAPIKEEDVNQYILNKSKELIEAGLGAVQDMTPYVVQGQNPDDIAALAELMSATTRAIEAMNKSNLLNKKAEKDEKLKRIEIEARKEIAQLTAGPTNVTNNNVLVASREEIMKKLFPREQGEVLNLDNK